MCPEWLCPPLGTGGFDTFLRDLGERPADRTLDRIDVHGHYEPENCRWSDKYEQAGNQRGILRAGQGVFGDEEDRWEPEEWLVTPKWPDLLVVQHRPAPPGAPEDEEPWPF